MQSSNTLQPPPPLQLSPSSTSPPLPQPQQHPVAVVSSGSVVDNELFLRRVQHPLPHTYLDPSSIPNNFTWQNVNGRSYLTPVRNQHVPQYCGSCWAHSALTVLADRVKIARSHLGPLRQCRSTSRGAATVAAIISADDMHGRDTENDVAPSRTTTTLLGELGPPPGPDITLSVQWLLNCGPKPTINSAEANNEQHAPHLSCHGGSALRAYDYIYNTLQFVPEESCLSYLACSDDSDEGFCPLVRDLTSCTMDNACRRKTCIPDNFVDDMDGVHGPSEDEEERREGGAHHDDCQDAVPLPGTIPNVTIAEYGSIEVGNIHAIQAEIYARGPVKTSINADFLRNYTGGILGSDDDPALLNTNHNHGVSIVGWGFDPERNTQHWIIRNSWGHYWGELGYFRIELGRNLLGVEENLAWATPRTWTTFGDDCYNTYVDPSFDIVAILRR